MRKLTWAILPVAAVALAGCNSGGFESSDKQADAGPQTSKSYALEGFSGVLLSTADTVTVRRGDAFSVSATGPENYLDKLEIDVDGTMLRIQIKHDSWNFTRHKPAKILITMPLLTMVKLAGSGDIDADIVEGDDVKASLAGSGDLKIGAVKAKNLVLHIAGSGQLGVAGGDAATGDYSTAGSGDISAEGVTIGDLDVSVAGSGDIDAHATGKASIRVMGSGDVKVTGGASCTSRKMGSGDVTCS